MDHSLYRPEDFACDESYLRYYFRLNEKDTSYWEHWIRTHPEKLDIIMSADQLIGFLSLQLPEEEFQHEYDRFTRAIAKSALQETTRIAAWKNPEDIRVPRRKPRQGRRAGFWLVVVTILLVAGSTYLFEYHRHAHTAGVSLPGNMIRKENTGAATMDITLEEGSLIRLERGAALSWPEHFLPAKREAVLEGAAFFSISKDARRPFYVYCNNLVIHVLGTGFFVTPGKQDNSTEIGVSAGKVEVYEKQARASKAGLPQNAGNGVVLTPNEKLIYTAGNGQFTLTLVDDPMPLTGEQGLGDSLLTRGMDGFNCNNVRVDAILQSLENLYGINIDVENDALYNCRFTGNLGRMSLYDRLSAVCRALHTTYEIKGTNILIRGIGCDGG